MPFQLRTHRQSVGRPAGTNCTVNERFVYQDGSADYSQVLLKFHFACYTIETMLRLAAPVLISAGVLNDETSLMQGLKPRR